MITIAKRFTFDAAHHIPTMPEGHKCRGMHGHTYEVELVFQWTDDQFTWDKGYAIEYGVISDIWFDKVFSRIDHKVLNDVAGLEVPTTEILARWIYDRITLDACISVRVAESSSTWAVYRPDIVV